MMSDDFWPPIPPNVRFLLSNVQFFGVISDPPSSPKIVSLVSSDEIWKKKLSKIFFGGNSLSTQEFYLKSKYVDRK